MNFEEAIKIVMDAEVECECCLVKCHNKNGELKTNGAGEPVYPYCAGRNPEDYLEHDHTIEVAEDVLRDSYLERC